MTVAVIYLFVSPSGRAYAGRHTCQHEGWPRRGSGALPSGYRGSGKLWQNVARKHGPALRWIILRRFPEGTPRAQVDAAERRAVRLARSLWAGRCMNVLEGGEGLTSADVAARWADPEHAAKMKTGLKAAMNRPEVKAKVSAARKAMWSDPEHAAKISIARKAMWSDPQTRERMVAAQKEAQNRPEVRDRSSAASKESNARPEVKAKISAASKAMWADPDHAAKISAASKAMWSDPERAAKHSAAIKEAVNRPEVKAKRAATKLRNFIRAANARNKARREAAMEVTNAQG